MVAPDRSPISAAVNDSERRRIQRTNCDHGDETMSELKNVQYTAKGHATRGWDGGASSTRCEIGSWRDFGGSTRFMGCGSSEWNDKRPSY
jgi:hypothetical protein